MKFSQIKSMLMILIFLSIAVIGAIFYNYNNHKDEAKTAIAEYKLNNDATTEETTEATTIKVYITGEVNKPDVYSMPYEARLQDLVKKAGGFTDDAYIANLNLAMHLRDGEKIVVDNAKDIVDKSTDLDENIDSSDDELININTAGVDELKKLDKIGEQLAQAIVAYREEYGDFTSIEEIREVDGIGEGIFEKIKDKITIQ